MRDYLAPVAGLSEGAAAYRAAMRRIALALLAIDAPLLGLVAVASYVLARRSIAPLVAAAERERRFAADIAHELRTPLATVASVAQAARGDVDGSTRVALDTIASAALDASRLVGDLLLLARAERPESLAREVVDLADTVTRIVREYDGRRDGVRIERDIASALAEADERRIAQLVRNLLDNAVRHARALVRVRCGVAGRCIEIAIEDDGPGVDPRIRARLFERFVRASEGGTGLGLAISRWVARAHGGDVTLEAPARFVARLPRLEGPGAQ